MSIITKIQNYKYSIKSPDRVQTVTLEDENLEQAESQNVSEQNQAPESWAQKLNARRKEFLAGLKLPKKENLSIYSNKEQITDMDSGEELDRMERGERIPGEGLQGILKGLKKKFGNKEVGQQEVGEVKSMIEKLKDLSPQDKAKVAMLALGALGLSAVAINAAIPVIFGTTVGGVLGTGFGTFGANLMGSQVLGFGAIQGVNGVSYGAAATAAKWYAGGIAVGSAAGVFKSVKGIYNKINNGSKTLTPAQDLQNYENQVEAIENDNELSEEQKKQARADLINDRINAKTQKPIGSINNPTQPEVTAQPAKTSEQVNQISIDHGLEYDDYDAWVGGMKGEIYRNATDKNNVDLNNFDLSPEAFAQAKLEYSQVKVNQPNNSFNQPPAAPQASKNVVEIGSVEDLNKDLEQSNDRVSGYQIEIARLKNVPQTKTTKAQISNLENAILGEQAKIKEIQAKLPSPQTQPKAPTTISTSTENSNIDPVEERIQKSIQDENYEQWEMAMVTKGLNQNPKGKRFDAGSFGISREKFEELIKNQNTTPAAPPENLQVATAENLPAKVESTISPEQREEVARYIEAKIANKYKITTFEQGLSNNGELSDLNPKEKMKNAQEIVIGDLHGDIKKFVEHLVLSEMAYLPKDDLEKLYAITENGNDSGSYSDASKMQELSTILSKVEWTGGSREFKLVGDVLSDRNGNDLVMVKYINQLRAKGANILTLSGNHDHNAFLPNAGVLGGRQHGQADSMLNARESAGFKTQADYFANPEIQKEYLQYAKNLKVFEYNPETQTLIAHAPIFEKTFQQWHKIMVHKKIITENDFNKLDIADFTEKLNGFYQSYLQELILKGQSGKTMEDFLMNEDTALLFARNGGDNGQSNDLPTFNGQIKMLINGHNTCENSPTSSKGLIGNKDFVNVCLDNSAGKYDNENGNNSPVFLVPGQTLATPKVEIAQAESVQPIDPKSQELANVRQRLAVVESQIAQNAGKAKTGDTLTHYLYQATERTKLNKEIIQLELELSQQNQSQLLNPNKVPAPQNQVPSIPNPQFNINTTINSAPVTPTQPPAPKKYVAPPPPPKPVLQVVQPVNNINSAPQVPNPAPSVESQESNNFNPKSYEVAAQKFIAKAFSDKLTKLQLENEIKAFTNTNWGYSDSIFRNSQGKEVPQKTIESMITTNQTAERFSKSTNFDQFLGSFLDHMSYVQGGSIFRNYKYNSFMYLALARMDQGISQEIVQFCKNCPSEGFGNNAGYRDQFIVDLKKSGKLDQYQKAFQDVFTSF